MTVETDLARHEQAMTKSAMCEAYYEDLHKRAREAVEDALTGPGAITLLADAIGSEEALELLADLLAIYVEYGGAAPGRRAQLIDKLVPATRSALERVYEAQAERMERSESRG